MTRVKPLARSLKFLSERKSWIWLALLTGAVLSVWGLDQLMQSNVYRSVERFAFGTGESYNRWFSQQSTDNPFLLIGLAFWGGLLASISPCILSMLPVNLSYIGTREITSRRDALIKASAFVLGVVTVLSVLGVFSSLAGFVFVKYRGYFYLLVGAIIVLMGLTLAGIIHIPLPQNRWLRTPGMTKVSSNPATSSGRQTIQSTFIGPYSVGLTFALVSSPCTSPVMISVLSAAAATGSQVQSIFVMASYAIGYTAIIFLASLFTGLAKQTRMLLTHSKLVVNLASAVLLVAGVYYLINGGHWVFAVLQTAG